MTKYVILTRLGNDSQTCHNKFTKKYLTLEFQPFTSTSEHCSPTDCAA